MATRKITGLAVAFLLPFNLYCWGFFGHKLINKMAVFTLPPEMIGFYKKHIDFISSHAVDADRRKHTDPEEAVRHYLDTEHYLHFNSKQTVDSIPFKWNSAIDKYGKDSLKAWGQLPWTIKRVYYALESAFRDSNPEKILRLSADLGHYVADGHVPLHTTENYNGQLSGQKGIHGLWETKIPELCSGEYDFFTGKPQYIKDVDLFVRQIIASSYLEKDTVLQTEMQLTKSFASDTKYSMAEKYNAVKKDYSKEFVKAYSDELNGMVERKMRKSIWAISCFWYSAWINAGQPDLNNL